MLKGKYVLPVLAATVLCAQALSFNWANSGVVSPCSSVVTAAAGVVLVCPLGDGDPLTAPVGGGNAQITVTVKDATIPSQFIPGIPATDMWLVGCNDGLLLCGGSQGSSADAATNAFGQTTFSNEPVAGGCDTGLYVVVQSIIIGCPPQCLAIAVRSPDYKSAGAPGPAPCGGDSRCPDSKVTNADFSWFVTHYPTGANPGATYLACADYAAPLGAPIGLADFSKFTVHFAGAGHKCPI